MHRGQLLAVAAALVLVGCGGAVDSQEEATGTTQSAVTVCDGGVCTTTYTGVLKSVDLINHTVTIATNGGPTIVLTHTPGTVHVGVVPGPMRGVVPGPMHGIEIAWNRAIANGGHEELFLMLLARFASGATGAAVTTTDNTTITSVQPLP